MSQGIDVASLLGVNDAVVLLDVTFRGFFSYLWNSVNNSGFSDFI